MTHLSPRKEKDRIANSDLIALGLAPYVRCWRFSRLDLLKTSISGFDPEPPNWIAAFSPCPGMREVSRQLALASKREISGSRWIASSIIPLRFSHRGENVYEITHSFWRRFYLVVGWLC